MATSARRQTLASFTQPQRASANELGIFLPGNMLRPTERGNPDRKFNDQDQYELSSDNQAQISLAVTFRVWATQVDVLTALLWPKVKLRENVQRVTGTRFTYDPMPIGPVPKRGTVRFMSKSMSSFSLAISQKGIGSRFEGSALRSPYGPNLLALETEAYAESISIGMAINTGINAVNVAFRRPYEKDGADFTRTRVQQMRQEMRLFAVAGRDQSRLMLEIDNILTENPLIDTCLVPNRWSNILVERLAPGVPALRDTYLYTMDPAGSGDFLQIQSPDQVMTLTQMSGGRVSVHEMPTFRYAKSKSFQPLATTNHLGEVYGMYPENDPDNDSRYNPSSLNIYIYDQVRDDLVKMKFAEAIAHAAVWERSADQLDWKNPMNGYDERLRRYVAHLNAGPRASAASPHVQMTQERNGFHQHVYPVSYDSTKRQFHLPLFFGNLDFSHFRREDDFKMLVESIVASAKLQGEMLNQMQGDIALTKQLHDTIQGEQYIAENWAEIARLNIDASVEHGATGQKIFVGASTPDVRARAWGQAPTREWKANRYGSLTPPTNTDRFGMPAGYWNAAGLKTLASMPDHPLSEQASRVYRFLSVLQEQFQKVLRTSATFSEYEIPVNMHITDKVQYVMNACFGPTVPIFLAAPLDLAAGKKGSLVLAAADRAQRSLLAAT